MLYRYHEYMTLTPSHLYGTRDPENLHAKHQKQEEVYIKTSAGFEFKFRVLESGVRHIRIIIRINCIDYFRVSEADSRDPYIIFYGTLFLQTTTVMSTARVRLLSKCWYFAGACLYFLEILHYLDILPQTVFATQERVLSAMLSTGAITGIAIFTTIIPLLFLLSSRRDVWRTIWTDILDEFPPQPTFFVGLIVNDAVYQRAAGTSVLEGGSARTGVLIAQLWAHMKYIGIPLAGSVGFTAYSIVREQAKNTERALVKT
ncbi:hypothetical protein IW261DRAFT_1572367 [Armillaria novae-zelandiae]|uniref:Uncharacterized protein n=1 Tax=Armillaria novae-zelandiae TaxID=153914 RepID=A0AA39NTE7_9AGAR|nr:hypothetical protein IW261DRAFT_1572367 [Armillaria novae-zelandiae]